MISVVVPVYRSAANIPSLLEALVQLDRELGGELEVVLVVDGSPDESFRLLATSLPQTGLRAQLLGLSRNFGAFAAIRAGLEAGNGDYFTGMAADLQEPPELIVEFHRRLRSGTCDVVIGQRVGRDDPGMTKWLSALFWSLYRKLVMPQVPPGGLDVFGCTRPVRDQLLALRERNTSLVGLLLWIGFRREMVPYQRRARSIGKSAWSFRRRVGYLMDSIFGFTDLPVRFLLYIGVVGLLFSAVVTLAIVLAKLTTDFPIPGYAATVLLITFFGALNCFGLGIIGGYVWRTFENTKLRPDHIVAVHQEFVPGARAAQHCR